MNRRIYSRIVSSIDLVNTDVQKAQGRSEGGVLGVITPQNPKRVHGIKKEKILQIFLNCKPRRLYNGGSNCYFLIKAGGICKIFLKILSTVSPLNVLDSKTTFFLKKNVLNNHYTIFRIYQTIQLNKISYHYLYSYQGGSGRGGIFQKFRQQIIYFKVYRIDFP